MPTRRFPSPVEPLIDANRTMTHSWYLALQSLTSNPIDINNVSPKNTQYICDWTQGSETRVTLTQDLVITNSGAADGARLTLSLIQGPGAPFNVQFTSETDFGAAGRPTLSTEQNAHDRLFLIYNAGMGTYDVEDFVPGFGAPASGISNSIQVGGYLIFEDTSGNLSVRAPNGKILPLVTSSS